MRDLREASRGRARRRPGCRSTSDPPPAVAEPGELLEDERLVAGELPVVPSVRDVPQRDLRVLVGQGDPEQVGIDRTEDGLDVGHRPRCYALRRPGRSPPMPGIFDIHPSPSFEVRRMFQRWGAFVYRFRRPVAVLAVVVAIASSFLAAQAADSLSAGGWLDVDSESALVAERLDAEFGDGQELDDRPLPLDRCRR